MATKKANNSKKAPVAKKQTKKAPVKASKKAKEVARGEVAVMTGRSGPRNYAISDSTGAWTASALLRAMGADGEFQVLTYQQMTDVCHALGFTDVSPITARCQAGAAWLSEAKPGDTCPRGICHPIPAETRKQLRAAVKQLA